MQKFTVSRDDAIYEAWPDVVLCDSGRMVCVFTECRHHGNRDRSRLVYCISDNRGRTWSKKRYLSEKGTGTNFYDCARINKLSDGRLVIVCNHLEWEGEAAKATRVADAHNHLWFSSDEGETWEGPIDTPARGIMPDKIIELKSGRWLLAVHHPSPEHGKLTEYLWYSDDKGATWSERILLATDERYNLCEVSMIEAEPNVVIAFFRENSGMGWDCFKAISKDGGESWDGVYNVPLPGCHRPTAGFLNDGRVLVTYRFMHGGKGWLGAWTQNTFGALLNCDELLSTERKGQAARIFPIDFDRSAVSDCGYTGWVQYPDGEIYIVNYIVDDAPKAYIRGYSLRADELLIIPPSEE